MEKYHCTSCGELIPDDIDPDFIAERNKRGQMSVFATVPELCDACRDERFWSDFDERKEG